MYSRSRIKELDSICLWLGLGSKCHSGNRREEASALRQKNLDITKASLEVLINIYNFIRVQVTILQVTIAWVYN